MRNNYLEKTQIQDKDNIIKEDNNNSINNVSKSFENCSMDDIFVKLKNLCIQNKNKNIYQKKNFSSFENIKFTTGINLKLDVIHDLYEKENSKNENGEIAKGNMKIENEMINNSSQYDILKNKLPNIVNIEEKKKEEYKIEIDNIQQKLKTSNMAKLSFKIFHANQEETSIEQTNKLLGNKRKPEKIEINNEFNSEINSIRCVPKPINLNQNKSINNQYREALNSNYLRMPDKKFQNDSKFSLFENFFMQFKKLIGSIMINVKIDDNKTRFEFNYIKKDGNNVYFEVKYDKLKKRVTNLLKKINNETELEYDIKSFNNENEANKRLIEELSWMLNDIDINGRKKEKRENLPKS